MINNLWFKNKKCISWPNVSVSLEQRKKFVLTILLTSTLYLSFFGLTLSAVNWVNHFLQDKEFRGANPLYILGIAAYFLCLFALTKKGYEKISTYLFLTVLFLIAASMSIVWGSMVPQAILMYALFIVITGILVNPKASFIVTFLVGLFLAILI